MFIHLIYTAANMTHICLKPLLGQRGGLSHSGLRRQFTASLYILEASTVAQHLLVALPPPHTEVSVPAGIAPGIIQQRQVMDR